MSDTLRPTRDQEVTEMKRMIAAVLALAFAVGLGLTIVPDARAENGQIAAGVAGGLIGGMLLGGALAARPAPPPPVYYAPPPPERVYIEEPACRMVRERYWDGYDWQYRRVEVCN